MAIAAAPLASADRLSGVWSGDRATLELTPHGGSFTEDCASTSIGPVVWRAGARRFTATGRKTTEGPGPQRADVAPKSVAVRFTGQFTGDRLDLNVGADGAPLAHYRLMPGRAVKRIRCL
ncbi:MAG: hypothetical protein H0X36_05230 [Sphingomonadaceae bacterium]|nr:hypothetical protein [Sphingomonadaceae bacterium]